MNSVFRFLRNLLTPSPSLETLEARDACYSAYFGEATNMYHSTNRVFPHIDLYHYGPTDARPFHIILTGGMAEYRQPVQYDDEPVRLELMMHLGSFQWWAANSLKVMAEYPARHGVFFARHHTVPLGCRLTEHSEISAILLAEPDAELTSGLSFSLEDEPVNYLLGIPITSAEHAFAMDVGCEELYQKLKECDCLVHTNDERPSVVEYTPKTAE